MATYILRDLPTDLWSEVKARAEREQRALRPLILELLAFYAQHGMPVSTASVLGAADGTAGGAVRLCWRDGRVSLGPGFPSGVSVFTVHHDGAHHWFEPTGLTDDEGRAVYFEVPSPAH